jgi:hypothetical protein
LPFREISINQMKQSSELGITTMFIIAPILSRLVGSVYGVSEGSGFAMIGGFAIMFQILFIVGFVLYWIGATKINTDG